jgi:hypothetical protein
MAIEMDFGFFLMLGGFHFFISAVGFQKINKFPILKISQFF